MPGFKGFWEVLEKYAATGETCPGCRGGCADPDCTIRICAREMKYHKEELDQAAIL